MNIYRGCQHGCIYCDSRNGCYRMDHPFEDIEVKENAILLLEQALKSKRKPCMIGTGAMSDPYMPLEEQLNMTGQALEVVEKYGFGITFLTKTDRFLRDLPLHSSQRELTAAQVRRIAPEYAGDGRVYFEIFVCPNEALTMEFCKHGARLEVLSPATVREAVAAELRKAAEQY